MTRRLPRRLGNDVLDVASKFSAYQRVADNLKCIRQRPLSLVERKENSFKPRRQPRRILGAALTPRMQHRINRRLNVYRGIAIHATAEKIVTDDVIISSEVNWNDRYVIETTGRHVLNNVVVEGTL